MAGTELLRVAEEAYLKQLGSLNELFGHMQSISTDSRVTFETSLTAAEFGKERESFLGDLTRKMGESTQLPTISEIERVWYEIMREMKATGEVLGIGREFGTALNKAYSAAGVEINNKEKGIFVTLSDDKKSNFLDTI